MNYLGKDLAALDLWALGNILKSLNDAEKRREEASKHPKFDRASNAKAMEFPSPNPEFLKLKAEVEEQIKQRQGV